MFYGVYDLDANHWNSRVELTSSRLVVLNGVSILGRARLTNRAELQSILQDDQKLSDLDLILRLYDHLGSELVKRIKGAFSFLIIHENTIWGARDHFGVYPFYYTREAQKLHFSDSPVELRRRLSEDVTINDEWLWQYLSYAQMPWDQSLYQEISRLPPAHEISFIKRINCKLRRGRR